MSTAPVFHFYEYPSGVKIAQFYCAGCQELHGVHVVGMPGVNAPVWDWNGDADKPTLSPSVLVRQGSLRHCHSFIRDGQIEFLSDCSHALAKTTPALLPVAEWPAAVLPYKLERS